MNKQQINQKHKKFYLTSQEYDKRQQNLQNYSFDKYLIIKKIGKGSFATVYRGIIIQTKQQVAIKIINLKQIHQTPRPQIRQIKLRLAQSQSRIMMMFDSINILKCYQCFQSEDFKFMILEYCNSGDLAQKIQKEKKIFEDQAIAILKQCVNAIGQCHRKKIIHRDLKPQNIMIHNGIYKIADFGFSKLLSIKGQNQRCINTTLGTVTTMAPQVKNFQPYGLKADIWSIGVIFFNMIFGTCPFDSKRNQDKIVMKISEQLEKEQFYQGVRISDPVRNFLKQVLVVDPTHRLGWRQLIEHQIFQEQKDILKSSFQRRVSIEVKAQEMIKLQAQVVIKENQHEGHNVDSILNSLISADQALQDMPSRKMEIQNQKQMKRQIKMHECQSEMIQQSGFQIKQIDQIQIRDANDQQRQFYQWAKKTYVECLKTELIFKKIVLQIQKYNLLDQSKRKNIQLLYLLATRCYNNMSPIYFYYQNFKNSQIIKELSENVEKLYKDVGDKWSRYSFKLTQKENQKLQIMTDWAKRIMNRIFAQAYDYHRKERFMTGIESMGMFRNSYQIYEDCNRQRITQGQNSSDPSLKDYTKQEQIKYTCDYFKTVKQRFANQQSRQCMQVLAYLNKLQQICDIKIQDLRNTTLQKYVQNIIKQ